MHVKRSTFYRLDPEEPEVAELRIQLLQGPLQSANIRSDESDLPIHVWPLWRGGRRLRQRCRADRTAIRGTQRLLEVQFLGLHLSRGSRGTQASEEDCAASSIAYAYHSAVPSQNWHYLINRIITY